MSTSQRPRRRTASTVTAGSGTIAAAVTTGPNEARGEERAAAHQADQNPQWIAWWVRIAGDAYPPR